MNYAEIKAKPKPHLWTASKKQKLIAFLQTQLGSYSGKCLRRLLEANLCRINGRVERFGSSLIQGGDRVELALNWKTALKPPKILSLQILYEDEFFKIINKPAGWICDASNALKTFGSGQYLVHRLDKDTTGLLIIAKSSQIRDQLIEMFEKREITKTYLAIVDGVPKDVQGERHSFLAKKRAFQGQTIWGSAQSGLSAITHWKKIASGKQSALILCEPVTGRTHQIRVHLSEMGHPILVDRQYAESFRCVLFIQRPLLHAYRLQFSFQGKVIDLTAPLFLDMRTTLKMLEMGEFCELFGKKE